MQYWKQRGEGEDHTLCLNLRKLKNCVHFWSILTVWYSLKENIDYSQGIFSNGDQGRLPHMSLKILCPGSSKPEHLTQSRPQRCWPTHKDDTGAYIIR